MLGVCLFVIVIACFTCLIASTIVTVLPVPGGPNTKYGAGFDTTVTMLHTAVFCSGFFSSFKSKNLHKHTHIKHSSEILHNVSLK